MIDYQNSLKFQHDMTCINNPNFLLSKNTVFENLLYSATNGINNENCIWFRNNGETWHTLYSMDAGYKEITLNGNKCILLLPQLIIHIGKNEYLKYDIEIYFKNANCDKNDIIESFLKVDEINCVIGKSNYVEESSEIIDYLLNDYNFKYDTSDNNSLKDSLNNHKEFFNDKPILEMKLDKMVEFWKNDIDDHINSNILHSVKINQHSYFSPSIYRKKKFFMGIFFELMKNIKLGNKKYIVYDINCRKNIKDSIDNKFENDNILLYDLDSDKKVTLPLSNIIKSKFEAHENGKNIITEKSIKVGSYLNYNGEQTNQKIIDISLNKELYEMELKLQKRTLDKLKNSEFSYSMIEQPTSIRANDIYDIIDIEDKTLKYPLFTIKDSTIVTKKDSSTKYSLEEIIEYVAYDKYYNITTKEFIRIYKNIFQEMLKKISSSEEELKSDNKLNNYSYGYVPDSSSYNRIKYMIKLSDDLFIDTLNNFIHIRSNDDDLDSVDINEFAVDCAILPCLINGIEINDKITYISHLKDSFNRKIKINNIRKIEYSLLFDYKTIDDMEKHVVEIDTIDKFLFGFDKQISINGLHVGQYGKIKNLGSVYGFKKSLWHGIKDFYERAFDGRKMVLFENNIAVCIDLIDIDYFNETSLKVKKKNEEFLSKHDLLNIKNSSKRLKDNIYTNINIVECEIINV